MQENLSQLNNMAVTTAREYTGKLAWPTVVLTLLVLVAFIANLWAFASGLLPVVVVTIIYAALTYMSYTPLHEAVHGNIHGGQDRWEWLNNLCGYLVAPLIMVPLSTHKVEHFTHHRYTNQPDKDPDYIVSDMHNGFLAFVGCAIRFMWMQNTFLFRDYWATAPMREKLYFGSEVLLSIGWRIAFVIAVPKSSTLLVLLIGYLCGAFFTVYWFAYRPHLPYEESARYRNTNSLIMPGWMKSLEWLWLGQNLHSVHHLFPRVPFYSYHQLHRRIEPAMRANGTPIIDIFNRRPIAHDHNHADRIR